MFKKLKDKIEEEFKQAPLKFPVSVQQLAQVISPSPSVNSLSDNNASSSHNYATDLPNVSTDFFSIGGDDEMQDGAASKMQLTLQNVDLTATSPSNMTQNMSRSRRSSLSSVTSEPSSSLFPIFESGLNQNFFQSDLESEMEDGMSGQLDRVSKEQMYQTFQKVLNRYNKYKGKYSELLKHYKELQHENFKTKNVLQESQDKALRRMAELREQCQLEQKAKAHLEESLRNDVEERDHVIDTLKTKISLLSSGDRNVQLIELDGFQDEDSNFKAAELFHLKSQNEDLQKEVEKLKKIKETACHFIHRCDTTINEAAADLQNDNIKRKMSELKSEIQKMKSENESLSHLLSRNNIIIEEDKRSQESIDSGNGSFLADFTVGESAKGPDDEDPTKSEEKSKKIEKLNNLLLKCKEKINELNSEIKAKNLIIEENQKRLKTLKEEIEMMKAREEENALSVAENKKAIHEELDAKEKQIKALTKELKTKENEFIKEKEDIIRSHENKIRDLTADFAEKIKTKTEENRALQEDLKSKKIMSEASNKCNSSKDNFSNLVEVLKTTSFNFEAMANSKAVQIEMAHRKLEDRVVAAGKKVAKLMETKQMRRDNVEPEIVKQHREPDLESWPARFGASESTENFHVVEKLKSEVMNLTKKIGFLESDLQKARIAAKSEEEQKLDWIERFGRIEKECETLRVEFQEKTEKNAELGKALTEKKEEEMKRAETEKEMLQNMSREKIETESKLKEYTEKYQKLEAENRTLQNDLMEKCGKLLKDLNDSKEKVKNLEEEGKTKTAEIEALKRKHSIEEKKKSKEIQDLKKEREKMKADTDVNEQKLKENLENLKIESEELKKAVAEGAETRKELDCKMKEIETLKTEVSAWESRRKDLEELELVRREKVAEKEANERLKNELEALRGNLKGELKEKEDKCILVDKLTQECNLLMAEIESLKKAHSAAENKLENEIKEARNESAIQKASLKTLEKLLEETQKALKVKEENLEEARKMQEALTAENDSLKETSSRNEALLSESGSDVKEIKRRLEESEKARTEMNEKMFKLTNEMNEACGELQVKQGELETLRSSLKSLQAELSEKEKNFEEERIRLASESENKLNILKNEIKYINTKHEEDIGNYEENLNSEMKEANEKMVIAEKTSAELLDKLEKVTSERDELRAADEEKNMKITELENCMIALKAELDEKFNETAKNEEENIKRHNSKIKDIVMQYDKEIAERDEEIETLKHKLEGAEDGEDLKEKHGKEIREIIMQYDSEIAQRDEEIESLKLMLSDREAILRELNSVKEELIEVKKGSSNGSRDSENEKPEAGESMPEEFEKAFEKERLRLEMEKEKAVALEREIWETRLAAAIEKHKKQSGNVDKKGDVMTSGNLLEEVNAEPAIKPSIATRVESGSSSTEFLEKQLIQQAEEMKELKKQYKKEIMELKKVASKRRLRKNSTDNQDWYYTCGGLDNDTEHEYLRNILYEYMMGKEQLVLAKVLSAIVKFNEEQTHKVLEKEQQRQTLVGAKRNHAKSPSFKRARRHF